MGLISDLHECRLTIVSLFLIVFLLVCGMRLSQDQYTLFCVNRSCHTDHHFASTAVAHWSLKEPDVPEFIEILGVT